MDTLTHALSGALLARAVAPGTASTGGMGMRERMTVVALAAASPDIDFVASYFGPLTYLHNHRGITHSLLMLPLWAVLLGWLCALLVSRDGARWRVYAPLFAMGIGIHILGDLITPYGTMIFAPLSDARYAWSTTFIIDLWFSGIICAGLIACAVKHGTRVPAVVSLCVLVGYVGFQWVLQRRALGVGEQYARAAGLAQFTVGAVPAPVLPFNWMVVVRTPDDSYRYARISLLRDAPPPPLAEDAGFIARLNAPYLPPAQAQWIQAAKYGANADDQALTREAWEQPQFGFFRWFAAYPALYRIERTPGSQCVWFDDLRYLTPGRATVPFRYGLCRESGGVWQTFQLVDGGRRAVF